MPVINLKLNYENNGQTDKIQYSFDLIATAISRKYNNSLGQDERKLYADIYKKIKAAIAANPQTGDVDFTAQEKQYIYSVFEVVSSSVQESIDFYKLEKQFK